MLGPSRNLGMDRTITPLILRRDDRRCMACGFALPFVLAEHHKIPRFLGGLDTKSNLTTLCANCHRAVHWLSVGRRLEDPAADQLKQAVDPGTYNQLRRFAALIRRHRRRTLLAGNRWTKAGGRARDRIPLSEALQLIAVRNGLEPAEAKVMFRVVRRAVRSIPAHIRQQCSFRLIRNGAYLSVNAGNHLVFRTPAYSDDGTRQDADLFLIWPQAIRMSVIPRREWSAISRGSRFAAIPCFNIDLTFDEAMALQPSDWRVFGEACRDALLVRRTRSWVSNVEVPW